MATDGFYDGDSDEVRCPTCNKGPYKQIASHWSLGDCQPPDFSPRQRNILDGLVLGRQNFHPPDDTSAKYPYFRIASKNLAFLEWIQDEFGVHAGEINRSDEGYDNYTGSLVCSENLSEQYERWMANGNYAIPRNIRLNPLVTSVWYAQSGDIDFNQSIIHLSVGQLTHDIDELILQFSEAPFEVESGSYNTKQQLIVQDVDDFIQWIDEPPAGFEYKWERYEPEYRRRKSHRQSSSVDGNATPAIVEVKEPVTIEEIEEEPKEEVVLVEGENGTYDIQDISDLNDAFTDIDSIITGLVDRIDTLEDRLSDLETMESRLSDLEEIDRESRRNDRSTEIDAIKERLATLETETTDATDTEGPDTIEDDSTEATASDDTITISSGETTIVVNPED